jgi:hypothetical protein
MRDSFAASESVGQVPQGVARLARITQGGARAGIRRGGGVARSRQRGATAIEGTSCGLRTKLEGAAVGAYAEKYRFAAGVSVGCCQIGKTPHRAKT